MAASSSSRASFFGLRQDYQSHLFMSSSAAAPPPPHHHQPPPEQPRTPNFDCEVIALSPKTLMTTNGFICEVCQKGFQREQNLQFHRRSHNLQSKLNKKSNKEVKRKVYLCPERTCVNHDPSRALGGLTGIKKHYFRKHGDKRWKCEKCAKRYAVECDLKVHIKTCGTKEYSCDSCDTIFTRSDSFNKHKALCDMFAKEKARNQFPYGQNTNNSNNINTSSSMIFGLSHMGTPQTFSHTGLGGAGREEAASSYFMQEQNQYRFHHDQQHHQGFLSPNHNMKLSPMSFQHNPMQFSSHDHNEVASSDLKQSKILKGI